MTCFDTAGMYPANGFPTARHHDLPPTLWKQALWQASSMGLRNQCTWPMEINLIIMKQPFGNICEQSLFDMVSAFIYQQDRGESIHIKSIAPASLKDSMPCFPKLRLTRLPSVKVVTIASSEGSHVETTVSEWTEGFLSWGNLFLPIWASQLKLCSDVPLLCSIVRT